MIRYLKSIPLKERSYQITHFPIQSNLNARQQELINMKKSLEKRYQKINTLRKNPSLDEDAIDELRDDIEDLNSDYDIFDKWEILQRYLQKEFDNIQNKKNAKNREIAFEKFATEIFKKADERLQCFREWRKELDAPQDISTKA